MYEICDLKHKKSKSKSDRWIWTGFIKEKSVNILVAQQSRGKSQLALQLCANLVKTKRNDKVLLDAPVTSNVKKILYISSEMNEELIYERAQEMSITRCKKGKEIFKYAYAPTLEFKRLEAYLDAVKPDFVIVDIFDCLLKSNGFDVNSYADLNDCANRLRKYDTTFLLIHHMNKNGTAMGSVATLSAMDTRMEMLETFREMVENKVVIHQNIHVYGKSVTDRYVGVKFVYPRFEIEYSEEEEEELDKPLGRLMERVISKYYDEKEHSEDDSKYPVDGHVVGTFQEVAAKLGMIDKYQFSPKRMANLLTINKETLNNNFVYFKTKKKSKAMVVDIWHDPDAKENSILDEE